MIVLLECLILVVMGRLLFRNYTNPTVIFAGVWGVIFLVYETNKYGMYAIRDQTYTIVGISILFFAIGAIMAQAIFKRRKLVFRQSRETYTYYFDYKLFYFLSITSLLIVIPDAIEAIKILIMSGGKMGLVRERYSSGQGALHFIGFSLYRNYIVKPFLTTVPAFFAYELLCGHKKKTVFWLSVALVALNIVASGGRIAIMYMVFHLLLLAIILKKKIVLQRKTKRVILGVVLLAVAATILVSIQRGTNDLRRMLAVYISGCVPLLDRYVNAMPIQPTTWFGLLLSKGYLVTIFTLLENLGFPYPKILAMVEPLLDFEQTVSIGTGVHMNAYVSLFCYFWMDSQYLGITMGMFIYGAICGYFYQRINDQNNQRSIIAYMILAQGLVMSMVRFQFVLDSYAWSFVFIPLLFKKKVEERKSWRS